MVDLKTTASRRRFAAKFHFPVKNNSAINDVMTPPSSKPIIAAFDFDGTITTRDTLVSFLFHVAGVQKTIFKLLKLTPYFIGYLFNVYPRQQMKEIILTSFLAGLPAQHLQEMGDSFARSPSLKALMRPEAIKKIEWHQKHNHRCILISASIDTYLKPWSQWMKFDDLICSSLEIDTTGNVTGKLKATNCWGPEKQRRLTTLLEPRDKYCLYAYGDSRGDRELLAFADYSFYRKFN